MATEVTTLRTDAENNAAPVSPLADTDSNERGHGEPGTQSKYPAWLLELTHQLRNFRQWRLIIKPDQTLDLDYLAMLALQAQRRARPYTAPPQLNLFALDPIVDDPQAADQQTISEATSMTAMLALSHATPDDDTSTATLAPFTIINGNNRTTRPNTIILPDEILTIEADELLHDYLGRVAGSAMEAAIDACGSQEAAFIRLGSKAPQERSDTAVPFPSPRPTLVLAPAREHPQTSPQPRRRPSRS
ncbi:MAG: hypothetical protein H0V18_20175 [Pyrinomonadaceae bacterium]|nr:hypothetical protein [Pyrinomonadaceae bacterium]